MYSNTSSGFGSGQRGAGGIAAEEVGSDHIHALIVHWAERITATSRVGGVVMQFGLDLRHVFGEPSDYSVVSLFKGHRLKRGFGSLFCAKVRFYARF